MERQRSLETKVGIVSVIGTILLILGISLGKGINVGAETYQLKISVNNSGGIKQGEPLNVNGVERGSVSSVSNENGNVIITATINGIDDIRSDASAEVLIQELTGGRKIEIDPGNSSEELDPDSIIPGKNSGDLGEIVALISDLGSDAASLVRRLDTLSYEVNSILRDEQGSEKIRTAINDGGEILAKINTLLDDNYDNIDMTLSDLRILSADLKEMVKKNDPKIDELMTKLNSTLENAESAISDVKDLSGKTGRFIDEINTIASDIRSGDGLAHSLIYDKTMSAKLDSLVIGIDSLVTFISRHGVNVNVRLGTRP